MRKALGLSGFLLVLVGLTVGWEVAQTGSTRFATAANLRNLLTYVGLFGILSLGQAFVIITGGIDLSVGSLVCLLGILAAMLMDAGAGWSPWLVLPAMLALAALVGGYHGLLVTKLRIQPFVVTLCGLFLYRGVARLAASDSTQGFGTAYDGLKWFGRGTLYDLVRGEGPMLPGTSWETALDCVPAPFLIMLFLAVLVGAYLHWSPHGRHLFALGANEEGARFSGVRTDSLKVLAYVLCSLLCGAGGLLLAFKSNSLQPTMFGNLYELYAIAGAVLGGCSLRGGSGNVVGIVLGVAIIRILSNMVNILGIPSQVEYIVLGGAILVGVCIDELVGRQARSRARARV